MKKIVAVASGGGHWVEMRRILPALDGLEVVYASVDADLDPDLAPARYYRVRNVSRHDRLGFAVALWQCARLMWRERPEVVISTGAAPGLVALAVAKLLPQPHRLDQFHRQHQAAVAVGPAGAAGGGRLAGAVAAPGAPGRARLLGRGAVEFARTRAQAHPIDLSGLSLRR